MRSVRPPRAARRRSAVRSGAAPSSTSTSPSNPSSALFADATASPVPRGSRCTATSTPSPTSVAARRDDDDERVGAELVSGVERPVEHAPAEQRVQVLRRRGAHARTEAGGHDDGCEWTAHAADDGWGARIRTWDRGTKTRCLTTWLRPSERIVSVGRATRLRRSRGSGGSSLLAVGEEDQERDRSEDAARGPALPRRGGTRTAPRPRRATATPLRSRTPGGRCRSGRHARRTRRTRPPGRRSPITVQRLTSCRSATRMPSATAIQRAIRRRRARSQRPVRVEPCSIGCAPSSVTGQKYHAGTVIQTRPRGSRARCAARASLRSLEEPVDRRARRR